MLGDYTGAPGADGILVGWGSGGRVDAEDRLPR